MNVPNNAKSCQNDLTYCKFGSATLIKLLTVFEDHIGGAIKDTDIEYVHKTRVTSRRLRAAMPLFRGCFRRRDYKKWRRGIKKVTRLLGDARDLDVQIIFVEQYMEKLNSAVEKASMKILFKNHEERRRSIQPFVANGLEELKASHVLEDMFKFCQQISKERSGQAFDPEKALEKARWNISFRLDDFLALESFVHLENEIAKHHEMRICAKKLRYTMESFADLYQNKLSQEIETIKTFQDELGEMHDCDVWAEYIPKFLQESASKTKSELKKKANIEVERSLLNFLTFVKEKRKGHYRKFTSFWDENKKNGFFVQLKETINGELARKDYEKTKQVILKPDVKIAILSDVHANLQALEKVFEDAEEREVDVFLNAGDSIGFGAHPNEVVELLCEKNVLSVLGNYDMEVIEGKVKAKGEKNMALKFARKELAKSCECYLYSLPHEIRLQVAGKKLLLTHRSPESIDDHIYHDTPVDRLKMLADDSKADLVIFGHSHEQFWRQVNETYFINPGSVGRPSDGNPQAAYAILSFNPIKVELVRLDYEVEEAAGALRKKGLPESFAQMLLSGVPLDTIIKEDKIKEDLVVQNCKEKVKVSKEVSEKYWPDTNHYLQVSKLSLAFFDGLTRLHKFGMKERCWLECAAILHDIGLSKSRTDHHKKSEKLILNDTQLPFGSQERRIIASIARYHRKAIPKQKHNSLTTLDQEAMYKIEILSSLLRVADSLDYTHQTVVDALNVKMIAGRVTVECVSKMKSTLEEQAFNKKKDLFEKVFAKKLVLIWKQP